MSFGPVWMTKAAQPMTWKYQFDPLWLTVSKTGKEERYPGPSVNPCRIGPIVWPVFTRTIAGQAARRQSRSRSTP